VTLENVLASCAMPPALYDLHAAATKRSIQPPVDDSPLAINDNFFFASDDGAKGRTEPANPSSAEEVVIPTEPLIENAIPAEETTLMVERATGPRILLIEDDPDQRAVISRVLELSGYSVDCAGSGIEGLVSANRKTPSLIVVDFMMPGVDGRETIRRLRQNDRTAETPILALTATPDPEIEYAMLNAGANDFCPKSVSKRVLLKRIERLLKNEAGD
jgi:CheY-like chemotaxis protein